MLQQVAINLNTNTIYGIGKDQDDAIKEAYLYEFLDRMDQGLERINLDSFKERNNIKFLKITKKAHSLIVIYRPPYVLNELIKDVCIKNGRIMSKEEAAEADARAERKRQQARERYQTKIKERKEYVNS